MWLNVELLDECSVSRGSLTIMTFRGPEHYRSSSLIMYSKHYRLGLGRATFTACIRTDMVLGLMAI